MSHGESKEKQGQQIQGQQGKDADERQDADEDARQGVHVMDNAAAARGLFGRAAPKLSLLPRRSQRIVTKDILLAKQTVHENHKRAALVLHLDGGQRAIDQTCELIDDEAYFRCVLEEEQLQKLLKMLVGILANHKLDDLTRLVQPVHGELRKKLAKQR